MQKRDTFHILKYLLMAYLGLTVLYPILRLFLGISGQNLVEVVQAPQFLPMLGNSILTTLIATFISVVLGFALAFALARSRVRFKSVWVVLFTIPMLIPSISHGMGLILSFGDNGVITNLLGLNIGLYGYPGIIMGSVLYSFPFAFLLFYDSFQYEDFTIYEAARVLGLSKTRQFLTITMPYMARTFVSAALAVFTMVFTDYGVALTVGGTVMTLPVFMYRQVIGMMDFAGGATVGLFLLLPAVVAFLIDLKKNSNSCTSSTTPRPYQVEANRRRDIAVYIFFAVVLTLVVLPIAVFAYLSFVEQYPIDMSLTWDNFHKLLTDGIGSFLLNSLAIALLTALVGTAFSYFSAYITARSGKKLSNQLLHLVSMLSLAIPGVVLGLSYLLAFNKLPIYSTIIILVVVNIVHFYSSPYLIAYNSLTKFNPNLEDVAKTLGISRLQMLRSVYIPSTIPSIIEMYSCFFANSMVTISAVSFLVSFRTNTLALMIPQLESQSFIEGTAVVSLMILGINVVEKGIAFFVKRSFLKKNNVPLDLDLELADRDATELCITE